MNTFFAWILILLAGCFIICPVGTVCAMFALFCAFWVLVLLKTTLCAIGRCSARFWRDNFSA